MRHRPFAYALAVTLSACATTPKTQLKEVQVAPQPPAQRPTKALVIGLSAKPEVRSAFEADMAARLQAVGVPPVQGTAVIPPGTQITVDVLRDVVKRTGADAVVIARLAGTREQQVVETMPAQSPFYGTRGFYGYYTVAAPVVYQESYLSTEQVVTLETRLYRTEGEGQLVWRGVSETFDPSTAGDVIRGADEKTVARMKADGVL
jgi:hypothetical protein